MMVGKPPDALPSRSGVRSPGLHVVLLALAYGLFFALARWGLDALFGFSPITYASLGIVGFFGYLTGGLTHR